MNFYGLSFMRLQLVILLGLIIAAIFGARAFSFSGIQGAAPFDYASATQEERSKYLTTLGRQLTGQFKPNYLAKDVGYSTGGRSITLVYKLHVSKLDCGMDYSCNIMQCKRYLKLPVSSNNISVRLRYLNPRDQRLGTQLLKNSTCEALIEKWKKRQTS